MSKHTPGPWKWEFEYQYWLLTGANGDVIADDGSAGGEYPPVIESTSPNAMLIAAAPDLLAACEAMITWANTPTVHTAEGAKTALRELTKVGELTRAAIAKAKGESSE